MSKPKILLLGKLPPPYMGPAVATQILLRSKLNECYELVHVDTNVHEALETIGVWKSDKVWKNVAIYVEFARVLQRERPDLVLIPISQATLGFLKDSVFILLSRLLGRKTVLQLRGSNMKNWLAAASAPMRHYVEAVIRSTQAAIVLGRNLRYLFADYHPDEWIFAVPNGADYEMPPRAAEKSGPVRVLYLANLMRSKGIEDVIEAAHLLNSRCPGAFAVDVIGAWLDAETQHRCDALMRTYQPPVTIHPPVHGPEKLRRLTEADIFVFPPREPEGHPWVIVEALAAGLPIISTDQGTITESVMDGENGFIVAPRRPEQIAEKLQLLIQDASLRQTFGEASRRHYLENFTEDKMVDQLRHAFDSVLAT